MKMFHGTLRSGDFRTARLEAFSDGVFAIVITLLILELRVPEVQGEHVARELLTGLVDLLPKFFSFVLSFFILRSTGPIIISFFI